MKRTWLFALLFLFIASAAQAEARFFPLAREAPVQFRAAPAAKFFPLARVGTVRAASRPVSAKETEEAVLPSEPLTRPRAPVASHEKAAQDPLQARALLAIFAQE